MTRKNVHISGIDGSLALDKLYNGTQPMIRVVQTAGKIFMQGLFSFYGSKLVCISRRWREFLRTGHAYSLITS